MVQKLGNDAISSQKLYPGIGSDKWRRQVGDDNKYVKETASPDFSRPMRYASGSPSAAARAVETTVTFRELIMVPQ